MRKILPLNNAFRRSLAKLAIFVYDRKIPAYLQHARNHFRSPLESKKLFQKEQLSKILIHAYRNTVFYKRLFDSINLIKDNAIDWENYRSIPILTKDVIRANKDDLTIHRRKERGAYSNTSGGSTGEPLELIQDREYYRKMIADTILFSEVNGKYPGDPEIKLWGSERDIIEGTRSLKDELINMLYNRVLLNSFIMDHKKMAEYVKIINTKKPIQIWAYVDSIYELSRFVLDSKITIHQPLNIVCTAGTLYKELKDVINLAFPESRVLNQYGSREVGVIGIESHAFEEIAVFSHSIVLELYDKSKNCYVDEGEGRIIVTSLNNYSMPLIRFDIGDIAMGRKETFNAIPNSYTYTALSAIKGRDNSHFKKQDGSIVHGEYFTHLFYHIPSIRKFRVVQNSYTDIMISLEVESGMNIPNDALKKIEDNISHVMGERCRVVFDIVERIEKSESGKYQFVFSRINN